jgi:hypothetical protein
MLSYLDQSQGASPGCGIAIYDLEQQSPQLTSPVVVGWPRFGSCRLISGVHLGGVIGDTTTNES